MLAQPFIWETLRLALNLLPFVQKSEFRVCNLSQPSKNRSDFAVINRGGGTTPWETVDRPPLRCPPPLIGQGCVCRHRWSTCRRTWHPVCTRLRAGCFYGCFCNQYNAERAVELKPCSNQHLQYVDHTPIESDAGNLSPGMYFDVTTNFSMKDGGLHMKKDEKKENVY